MSFHFFIISYFNIKYLSFNSNVLQFIEIENLLTVQYQNLSIYHLWALRINELIENVRLLMKTMFGEYLRINFKIVMSCLLCRVRSYIVS